MEELVKRLGHLPLALVQTGKYMMETGTSCPKYLELYASSWSRLVAEVPQLRDYENGSIHTTWMISYERVTHANPTAAKLLQLWSYLDHQDIWYELFHRGSQGCLECSWFQDLVQDEISFKKVIKTLLAYSLVQSRRDIESYSIHPVVHDWCTETISYGKADLLMLACTVIGFAVPRHTETEYWLSEQRLIPHADRCIQRLYQLDPTNTIEYSKSNDAFHGLGLLLFDQGKDGRSREDVPAGLEWKGESMGPRAYIHPRYCEQLGRSLSGSRQDGRGGEDVPAGLKWIRESMGP